MPRVKQTPQQKRAKVLYNRLQYQLRERRNKKGTILRPGRQLQFSLRDFEEWLAEMFPHGKRRCRYCAAEITVLDCTLDHGIPLSRGGGTGLYNLDPIDKACNDIKGKLTPSEYFLLRELVMKNFETEAQKDIFSRLQKAVGLANSVYFMRKKQKEIEV